MSRRPRDARAIQVFAPHRQGHKNACAPGRAHGEENKQEKDGASQCEDTAGETLPPLLRPDVRTSDSDRRHSRHLP